MLGQVRHQGEWWTSIQKIDLLETILGGGGGGRNSQRLVPYGLLTITFKGSKWMYQYQESNLKVLDLLNILIRKSFVIPKSCIIRTWDAIVASTNGKSQFLAPFCQHGAARIRLFFDMIMEDAFQDSCYCFLEQVSRPVAW